jgi:trans-aconitate methyltransferase
MSKYLDIWLDTDHSEYQKLLVTQEKLHLNSKELRDLLIPYLRERMRVFEIGCGPARNLHYLFKYMPSLKIGGNDLDRTACLENTSALIRNELQFFEMDTLAMTGTKADVDVLICSDHLMHVDPESVEKILKNIVEKWAPKYLLFREINVTTPDRDEGAAKRGVSPRLKHNIDGVISSTDKYTMLEFLPSKQDLNYTISLYERK